MYIQDVIKVMLKILTGSSSCWNDAKNLNLPYINIYSFWDTR